MDREKLLAAVNEHSGEWEMAPGVVLTPAPENDAGGIMATIVVGDTKCVFWLMNHMTENSEFLAHGMLNLKNMAAWYDAAKKLSAVFGYDMPNSDLRVVEKEVERVVDNTDHKEIARLGGQVEVYEKLLIGRAVNISK